jgi:hypothetical protein
MQKPQRRERDKHLLLEIRAAIEGRSRSFIGSGAIQIP